MCGIALVVEPLTARHAPHDELKFQEDIKSRLCQRGPDHFQRLNRRIDNTNGDKPIDSWSIAMCSAVLHLRGDEIVPQPIVDAADNVLCWNGEVFGMDDTSDQEDDEVILLHGSDTQYLSEKLHVAGRLLDDMTEEREKQTDPVVEVLRRVRGPFAMAWLHVSSQRIYFAHDRFGRRSLLYQQRCSGVVDLVEQLTANPGAGMASVTFSQTELSRFVLASVGVGGSDEGMTSYHELPASGVFVLDLRASSSVSEEHQYRLEFHPYAPLNPMIPVSLSSTSALDAPSYVQDRFGCNLPRPELHPETAEANIGAMEQASTLASSACALLVALSNAVGVRVRSIPPSPSTDELTKSARVAVLFSGGLDSVVLAALSHFHVPVAEPVALLTVCFDETSSFASPDRRAAELAHAELCALFPDRQWRLVQVNVPRSELAHNQAEVQALMSPCDTHMDFNIGAAFWFLSRGRGQPKLAPDAEHNTTLEELNAFLKPQRYDLRELEAEVSTLGLFNDSNIDGSALLCPVYRCGRKRKHGCVLGICKSCCLRMQRAVDKLIHHVNEHGDQATHSREIQGYRTKLMAMGIQTEERLDSLLDLLRSRASNSTPGQQLLSCRVHRIKQEHMDKPEAQTSPSIHCEVSESNVYQTTARVMLVGIGADEQLAGYGRHRTSLLNGGEAALRAELQEDLGRIWKRNLGRDDRCIAAHGREARFPYLDEHVVSTIATFPVSSLCDAELPRGVGDKRALRVVATTLGLRSCAGLAKRAIQFGSRIAKVSNTGSNRQTQGMNKFSSVE